MRISNAVVKISVPLSSPIRKMKISQFFTCGVALAIRSLSRSADAFQIATTSSPCRASNINSEGGTVSSFRSSAPPISSISNPLVSSPSIIGNYQHYKPRGYERHNTTRKFFSQRNDDNDSSSTKSIIEKTKDKVKSMIPSFLKPKSMLTKREQTRQEAKDNVSSSIDTMLKDAPLGLRMMGKMISPLISTAVGGLAEAMEEQSRQMSDLLDDARMYIVSDFSASDALGEPIEVGTPFSQSSSSMNINGKASSRINASFEVRGSRGGGVATMDATDGKLTRLVLNVNGRNLNISLTKRASPTTTVSSPSQSSKRTSGIGKNRVFKDDEIIDAEFVEKKFDK